MNHQPKRHLQTPADFATEFSEGIPNIHGLIDDLGKQITEKQMAHLTIDKKTFAIMLMLHNKMVEMETEMTVMRKIIREKVLVK
jgi:hypothetical protein